MTFFSNNVQFLYNLLLNREDFEDTVSVSVAKIMAKCRLWFSVRDAATVSSLDRGIYYLLTTVTPVFFVSALLYHVLHPHDDRQEVFIHKVAYLCMMVSALIVPYIAWRYPGEYSAIIDFVNRKSKECLLRADRHQNRALRNRIYLFLVALILGSVPVVVFVAYPIVAETVLRGRLYFHTVLPFTTTKNTRPGSLGIYVEFLLLHLTSIAYAYGFGTLFMAMVAEPYVRLAQSYQIMARDVRQLRKGRSTVDEGLELQKLIAIMREYEEIRGFVNLANRINSTFFSVLVFASFIFAGVFLAVSFSAETFLEKFTYIAYPLHTFTFACLPCALSEYLLQSGRELEFAVYDCLWYDAPMPFKKMVLMFLLRCQRPVQIDAKPFYELNLFLVARISKSIYAMATLAPNFF